MKRVSIINSQTGKTLLSGATAWQVDNWWDVYSLTYRHARGLEDITSSLQRVWLDRNGDTEYVVER